MVDSSSPVVEDDPEEKVLESILNTLSATGPMQLEAIVRMLELYSHPAAEKILSMAMADGMIVKDPKSGDISVNDFGRKISEEIRQSMGAEEIHGGGQQHYKRS